MSLASELQAAVARIAPPLFGSAEPLAPEQVVVQPTNPQHPGDYTVVTFPFSKLRWGKPEEIGDKLGQALQQELPQVAGYNVAKGFLNLEFTDTAWLEQVEAQRQAYADPAHSWRTNAGADTKVLVEYSSPNTNKPLHLGHLRNNFLGDALCRILECTGCQVVRANLVNDRGIHICKSMLAWRLYAQGATPQSTGQKGDHFVGDYYVRFEQALRAEAGPLLQSWLQGEAEPQNPEAQKLVAAYQAAESEDKRAGLADKLKEQARNAAPLMQQARQMLQDWENGVPEVVELWRTMNAWVLEGFRASYARMNVHFDQYYYESETYLLGKALVQEGLEQGAFYAREDGSIWAPLSGHGLDDKLLLRGDGTSVYMTQDLGTAEKKYTDHHMDRSVYVIGNEQDHHMKVLALILGQLGKPYANGLFHLSYGMVELPEGKMKSREGTVVDADDLMDEMQREAARMTAELGKIDALDAQQRQQLFEDLGLGALRFFLLKVDPKKRMVFDPRESIDFKGHTGPFVQYTHARICSLLEKAAQQGLAPGPLHSAAGPPFDLEPAEKDLIQHLLVYPNSLNNAAQQYDPSLLAAWLYEAAKRYNRFYIDCPVLKAADPARGQFRLSLSAHTRNGLAAALDNLGMAAVERM